MDLVDFIKQFIEKYYPRDHLLIAGALGVFFLIVLILPDSNEEAAAPSRARIAIPIELDRPQAASIPEPVEPLPEPIEMADPQALLADITVWRNVEVQSGDNLSAIFTKVGLWAASVAWARRSSFRIRTTWTEPRSPYRFRPVGR